MNSEHVVTGTMTDTKTIALDAAVLTVGMRVRVVVEELVPAPKITMQEAIAEISRRQKERGFVPMNTAQIDALFADPPFADDDEDDDEKDAA